MIADFVEDIETLRLNYQMIVFLNNEKKWIYKWIKLKLRRIIHIYKEKIYKKIVQFVENKIKKKIMKV